MLKKIVFFAVLGFVALSTLCAQQLTRFAVIDLPKVYMSFFRESRAVRDFEERSRRVQADIDRMTREIQELKSRQADLVLQGNQEQALRMDNEIYRKSEFLKEYYSSKTAELDDIRRKLAQSDEFYKQVYDEIRYIAESEGYTMVMNIKEAAILWYSSSVDITDKVILNLLDKSRR